MRARNWMVTAALAALAFTSGPAIAARLNPELPAASKTWAPKRTQWGDPDLTGTWPLDSLARTAFQRPERFGDRAQLTDAEFAAADRSAAAQRSLFDKEEKVGKLSVGHWTEYGKPLRQTSLIVEPANGRLPPLTEEGKRRAANMKSSWSHAVFDDLSDFNSLDLCITRGLPASMLPFPYNNGVRIFQGPGFVAIQLEIVHEMRIIPLDGRQGLPHGMQNWLGSSRGHFEGNTLVIETTHFNGQSPMVIVGPTNQPVPTSTSMRIVERLTPTGPDALQYEARIEDPVVLTAPWKMSFPWTRNDKYKLYEYACHEGNIQVAGYIRGTSPRFAAYRAQKKVEIDAAAHAAAAKPGG